MKLRLHGNKLRLRLSQTDVARLAETGKIRETLTFATGNGLAYCLESGPAESLSASLEDGEIRVILPSRLLTHWIQSDQVEIEGSDGPLFILIEKDFQCVHRNSAEDADGYPNPLAP
jgi:hypothetical protein